MTKYRQHEAQVTGIAESVSLVPWTLGTWATKLGAASTVQQKQQHTMTLHIAPQASDLKQTVTHLTPCEYLFHNRYTNKHHNNLHFFSQKFPRFKNKKTLNRKKIYHAQCNMLMTSYAKQETDKTLPLFSPFCSFCSFCSLSFCDWTNDHCDCDSGQVFLSTTAWIQYLCLWCIKTYSTLPVSNVRQNLKAISFSSRLKMVLFAVTPEKKAC